LAVKYSVKYEEMLEKMCGFFKTHFNARAVCSSTEARAASRARYAKEFTERKSKSSGLLPMIASACPGWVCYAEKTENALRDVNLLAKAKSPQAIAGTFAKKGRRAAFSEDTEEEEEEEEAYHVSVMPCFDKKLEASRREFKTKREGDVLGQGKDDDVDSFNETDCVLTTTEVVELLEKKCNIVDEAGVRSLPSAKIDSMFASWFRTEDMMDVEEDEQEDALLPPAFAATSGAYLEYVFRKAARDLYGVDLRGKDLEYKTLTNADMREVELKIEGEVKLKFLLAYGFRNVQNVTRALKREPNKWDFVEMMACPSGCANGGGQVPPKQSYLNAKLLKRVEEAYMEGEIESERRNLHSAAVKSLITSAEENGDTLSAYDTTYNALAASNDMKKKVTIANVDNW
jgi:iron only hydrogenase large subunit-like protein